MTKKLTIIFVIIFFVSFVLTVVFSSLAFNDIYSKMVEIVNNTQTKITRTEFDEDVKKIVVYGYGNMDVLKTPSKTAYFEQYKDSYYEYVVTPVDQDGVVEIYVYYKGLPDFNFTEEYLAEHIAVIMSSGISSSLYVPDEIIVERHEIYQQVDFVHNVPPETENTQDSETSQHDELSEIG